MTAKSAEFLLGIFRLAVAITLVSANSAGAQSEQLPAQAVDTQVNGQYNADPNPLGTAGTVEGVVVHDVGREWGPLRGVAIGLSAGIGHEDNVLRTESSTRSDFFWELRPSVYLDGGFGRHGFRLGYEGVFVKYAELSNQDFDDQRVFANGVLDFTRKVNLNLNGALRSGHDPRGGIGTCLVCSPTPDTWRAYRVGADLVIGRQISRAQIVPAIEYSGIRYTNNGQSIRDFDRQDYGLRGRWRFSPRLSGIAEGGYAIVDHLDPNNDLDRTESDLLGGVAWEATAKTSGEILIGTLIQDFDDPAQGRRANFNWDARIYWAPKPYSKVTLFSRRRIQEDAAGGAGHFLADTFGIGWQHAFSERFRVNTDADYTLADYSTGRQDSFVALQFGLTYQLTRWLDIGAQYRYLGRRSNIPGINYDDNIILLNLTAGLAHSL